MTVTVDKSSTFYYYWSGLVGLAELYALVFIIARASFPDLDDAFGANRWLVCDVCCDIIYLIDFALVESRRGIYLKYFSSKNS